jgi:hypothetical protein
MSSAKVDLIYISSMMIILKIIGTVVGAITLPVLVNLAATGFFTEYPVPKNAILALLGGLIGWRLSFSIHEPTAAVVGAIIFGIIGLATCSRFEFAPIWGLVTGAVFGALLVTEIVINFKKVKGTEK